MPKITRKRKATTPKADALTPEQQEKLLQTSQQVTPPPPGHAQATAQNQTIAKRVGGKPKKKAHRLTIDFPIDLYSRLKEEADTTGRTMKGLLVLVARDYLDRQEG